MGNAFEFRAIGVVRSPFKGEDVAPIQPAFAAGVLGLVEVEEEFAGALADLAGFDRIWVVYLFHRAPAFEPLVVPDLDTAPRGLFATRAPSRPNRIGLSVLRLLSVSGRLLHVMNVDILDGTPVLDIKPYVPEFDAFPNSRAGWLEEKLRAGRAADRRVLPEAGTAEGRGRWSWPERERET